MNVKQWREIRNDLQLKACYLNIHGIRYKIVNYLIRWINNNKI